MNWRTYYLTGLSRPECFLVTAAATVRAATLSICTLVQSDRTLHEEKVVRRASYLPENRCCSMPNTGTAASRRC